VHFFPQKVDDDLFSRRPQYTAKTAKLTTPTFKPSPTSKNFLKKLNSCSAWVHLQLTPVNYAKKYFLALGAPPGYAYVIAIRGLQIHTMSTRTKQLMSGVVYDRPARLRQQLLI